MAVGAQRNHSVLVREAVYLLDGLVNGSKCRLLVIMVNSPVTMENEDTFLISLLTVAAIDTVVWTVVPLAGEHIQAFCNAVREMTVNNCVYSIRNRYKLSSVYLMVNYQKKKNIFSKALFVS